jgi:hypothetical protein
VNTLRFLIAALALGIVAGSVLAPADVMAGPPAVLILFLAFGAIAADALPLQRVPLACSILTVPLALMLIVDPWRPLPVVVLAAAILTLQLVAWWRARRASSPARI